MNVTSGNMAFLCVLLCGPGVFAQNLIPGGIGTAGAIRLVPDTIIFDNNGQDALGNWEPYASVVGNTEFLVESNTFAEGVASMQRYGLMFQPVEGGEGVRGEVFFADDGTPYRGPINNYRQDGNPGRVAGDRRPGAVNFIAGGEACPDEFFEFLSDARWDTGVIRNGRYGAVQTYSLDSITLEQTPLSLAFDAINGRLMTGDPMTDQINRFGGELAGLGNGNFLVVVEDRSNLHAAGTAATAVLVDPDGSIIKDTFVIGSGSIWSNVAACQDGFCVRLNGTLLFYNNIGELQGQVDQQDVNLIDPLGNPIIFDRGRGDGTRIAAHINTPYVFLAGVSGSDVRLAVWDSLDQWFLAQTNVNELTAENGGTDELNFRPVLGRVDLAVDALNRIVVTYEVTMPGMAQAQTVARVLAFDEELLSFSYLTPTFFPFVNFNVQAGVGGAIRTIRPSPSMTTRQICIAAKGEINSGNRPEEGADTPSEVNFYTVITHPDPRWDPTTSVAPGPPEFFKRGDANSDGSTNIADAVNIIFYLFTGGKVSCVDALDVDDNGEMNISDTIYLLSYLFTGGPAPKVPFLSCGMDRTPDLLACEEFQPCQ